MSRHSEETRAKMSNTNMERWERRRLREAEWQQACAIEDPLERARALDAHTARWNAIEIELRAAKRRRNSAYQRAYITARKWRGLALRKAARDFDPDSPELASQEAKIHAVFDATMRAATRATMRDIIESNPPT